MSALPPDPPRLRAILAHLDKQLAENETVGIYLRPQRQAVLAALEHAERPPKPQRPARKVKGGGPLPGFPPPPVRTGYVVQHKRTPRGPEPAVFHLADCRMIEGTPHGIRPDEARAALTDPWQGSVAVRVGRSEVCGVWGRRYTASRLGPLPVESGVVPFESPLLGWTVAAQLVRALNDCSIVSPDEAVAAHA